MQLEYMPAAIKALAHRVPPHIGRAMRARLAAIAADPFAPHANVTRLSGAKDAFRLRVGDWRAVYFVSRDRQTVTVVKIAARGDVYR